MTYPLGPYANVFPGLWPTTSPGLTGPDLVPNCLCGTAALDVFSAGDEAEAWSDLAAPVAAIAMQQMMLDLLIAYFAAGMQQGRSFGAAPAWSGAAEPTSWSAPHRGNERARTDGARSHGERGIPDGLRENAANGARVVRQLGFDGTIGGIGQRAGRSDHPHGNAIDVMTHGDTAMGHRVAEHFRQNHAQLGVKYVIYQQRIASPRTGWQWRSMADRGNPTANHMDHPHISFR